MAWVLAQLDGTSWGDLVKLVGLPGALVIGVSLLWMRAVQMKRLRLGREFDEQMAAMQLAYDRLAAERERDAKINADSLAWLRKNNADWREVAYKATAQSERATDVKDTVTQRLIALRAIGDGQGGQGIQEGTAQR